MFFYSSFTITVTITTLTIHLHIPVGFPEGVFGVASVRHKILRLNILDLKPHVRFVAILGHNGVEPPAFTKRGREGDEIERG